MMIICLIPIVYLIYILFIIITSIITLARGERRCRNSFSESMMIFSEVVFTIIGPIIGFMRFDAFQPDIPFAKQHVLVVILFVITSSASFWLSRFTSKSSNPIIRIGISVGLLQGIVLCFITTIHFIPFIANGLMFPWIGFELLSPFIAFILLCREFYFYNKTEFNFNELLPYREELGFIPIPLKIIQLPLLNRIIVFGVLLIPVIIAQALFAYGCGQDLDSLIKAFTHSHGFVFSMNN